VRDNPHIRSLQADNVKAMLTQFDGANYMPLKVLSLAVDYRVWGPEPTGYRLRLRDALVSLPLLALAAAVGWYNLAGNPIHGTGFHGGSVVVTWLSSTVIVFRYLGHVLLPVDLRPWYPVPLRGSLLDPAVAFSVVGLVAVALATVWLIRTRHRGAFWILWFGITLAPTLNIIPFPSMMNDRYMYLALLGPLALAATRLDAVRSARVRQSVTAAALVVTLACVIVSVRQVEIWSNPLSLWAANTRRDPMWTPAPGNKPEGYEDQLAYVVEALEEHPGSPVLNNNLGVLHFRGGSIHDALARFEAADRLAPDDPIILTNLGFAYTFVDRFSEARRALERAAELQPHSYVSHLYLTRLYLTLGDVEGARRGVAALARIRPHRSLAFSWRKEREALERLEAAGRR
jgi:hypothetical protein